MNTQASAPSAARAAWVGLIGLAAAMGIGRFAFTPMLPLMQAAGELDLAQGAWLAGANYLGYLVGALACAWFAPAPLHAARLGLLAVALTTLAMALSTSVPLWLMLRFAAGAASACVLVGVSAWSLATLAALGRGDRAGWVFAGVGSGIALAGAVGLVAGVAAWRPAPTWLLLGAFSALAAAGVAAMLPRGSGSARRTAGARPRLNANEWRLVLCYGAFGFGYIVPATFLPALARERVGDPALFGWVWPAFGLAAALSTVLAASLFQRVPPRRLWAGAQLVMAAGLVVAAAHPSLAGLLVCAVCVGGTFMVMTMAGLQEGRRIAGDHAPQLIAALTAAFAAGQLIGPFSIRLFDVARDATLRGPQLLAAAVLLVAALALWPGETGAVPSVARSPQ